MNFVKRALLLITILCLFGMLGSCGFHLRGEEDIPVALQNIYLQSKTPFGSFEQTLRDSLRSYNITLTDTPDAAQTVLNIEHVSLSSVAGSVSANLSLRQYTLSYTVQYRILTPKGKVILPNNSVTSTTTFTSNMAAMMLSSKNSTQQYMPELQRDAVFRIISQLLSTDSRQTLKTFSQHNHLKAHENKS